jgi:hypothetical protein
MAGRPSRTIPRVTREHERQAERLRRTLAVASQSRALFCRSLATAGHTHAQIAELLEASERSVARWIGEAALRAPELEGER